MLQIPLKRTDPIIFSPSLKKYITQSYNQDASAYEKDCAEIDQLRAQATSNPSIEVLSRYFIQFQYISAKFPISEKGVKISFAWCHSFSPKRKYISYHSIFEKTCVMYNLGALLSQRAGQQNLTTEDGVKNACKFYQQASGIYQYLNDFVKASFNEIVSNDHSIHILKSLEILMLAQAQECFVNKAKMDNKPDSILTKIASQAADLYDQSYDAAVSSPDPNLNAFFERLDWLVHIQVRALYLHAFSQYRFGAMAQTASKYGEEIARLEVALQFLTKALQIAQKMPELTKEVKELQDQILNRMKLAQKDNDKIYMEIIPQFKTLPSIPRFLMVKPIPLTELTDTKITGPPLFDKLMPLAVHKCSNGYKPLKDEHVQKILYKIDEIANFTKISLGQMNLPSSLDAFEQPKGIPDTILLQSEEIKNDGGSRSLISTFENLQHLNKQQCDVIREAEAILIEEENEDSEIRSQFHSRWVRTPSKILTEPLHADVKRFLEILKKASSSDSLVQTKIDNHLPAIEQLGGNKADLEAAIPSSTGQTQSNPQVQILRQKLDELSKLMKNVTELSSEIKNFAQKDDIVPKLLEMYGTKPIENPQEAFDLQLATYTPLIEKINQLKSQIESLIESIKTENEKFLSSKASSDMVMKREKVLKALHDGYINYKDIKENIKEGTKFYYDMEGVVKHLKNQCEDFRFARKMEMRELVSEIQSSIVNTNRSVPPPSGNSGNSGYLYGSAPPVAAAPYPPQDPNMSYGYNPYYNPYSPSPYYR